MLRTHVIVLVHGLSRIDRLLLSRSVTEDAWASKDIEYTATTADYIVPIVSEVMVREKREATRYCGIYCL